jgi:hypothetical protein
MSLIKDEYYSNINNIKELEKKIKEAKNEKMIVDYIGFNTDYKYNSNKTEEDIEHLSNVKNLIDIYSKLDQSGINFVLKILIDPVTITSPIPTNDCHFIDKSIYPKMILPDKVEFIGYKERYDIYMKYFNLLKISIEKQKEQLIIQEEQKKKDEEQKKKDEEQKKKDEEQKKKDEEQKKKDKEEEEKNMLEYAIDEMMKDRDWIKFSGDENCNNRCRGWDGRSRRCDCGNRRLSWEYNGGYIYPEAY